MTDDIIVTATREAGGIYLCKVFCRNVEVFASATPGAAHGVAEFLRANPDVAYSAAHALKPRIDQIDAYDY